jgi:hypothetical protein
MTTTPIRVWSTVSATTYAVAAATANVLTSPIRLVHQFALQQTEGDGYDDVPVGWEEEVAAVAAAVAGGVGGSTLESVIDVQEFVFHVDLALECLRLLQNAATHSPNRILRLEASSSFNNNNNNNCQQYSWHGWLQQVATTAGAAKQPQQSDAANLLRHLPEAQTDLLLRSLVAANSDRFQIVRRAHAPDVVVFSTTHTTHTHHDENDKQQQQQQQSSLQTRLTLHDLSYAQWQVQERIDTTMEQRDTSTQRALAAQRSKNTKLAVAEMKRRQLYEQTLCQSYATLAKLEQVHATLETAVHQRDELDVLRQATEALQTIQRQHVSLEQVNEVFDDLQEQVDHVTRVNDTMASADENDDDELMKELHALTLGDGDNAKEEAKDDRSAETPANEISKSDEKKTPKPEASSSRTPVGILE